MSEKAGLQDIFNYDPLIAEEKAESEKDVKDKLISFGKRALSLLSKISSLILTIFDLFGLIVIVSFILHFILLIGCYLTQNEADKFFAYVFMFIFSILIGNVLLIPAWLFTKFTYFKGFPFVEIIYLFSILFPGASKCKPNNDKFWKTLSYVTHFIYGFYFLAIVSAIGVSFLGSNSFLDFMVFLSVIILPITRYSISIILYAINAWKGTFVNITAETKNGYDTIIYYDPFLLSFYYHDSISNHCDDVVKSSERARTSYAWLYFKFILSLITLIYLIVVQNNRNISAFTNIIFALIYFFIFLPLMVNIRFPFFWFSI